MTQYDDSNRDMTTQPEALRLADALRALHEALKYHPSGPGGQMCGSEQYRLVTSGLAFEDLQNAAAELRRLHAENDKFADGILAMNRRKQSDEALLRQALEALKRAYGYGTTLVDESTADAID